MLPFPKVIEYYEKNKAGTLKDYRGNTFEDLRNAQRLYICIFLIEPEVPFSESDILRAFNDEGEFFSTYKTVETLTAIAENSNFKALFANQTAQAKVNKIFSRQSILLNHFLNNVNDIDENLLLRLNSEPLLLFDTYKKELDQNRQNALEKFYLNNTAICNDFIIKVDAARLQNFYALTSQVFANETIKSEVTNWMLPRVRKSFCIDAKIPEALQNIFKDLSRVELNGKGLLRKLLTSRESIDVEILKTNAGLFSEILATYTLTVDEIKWLHASGVYNDFIRKYFAPTKDEVGAVVSHLEELTKLVNDEKTHNDLFEILAERFLILAEANDAYVFNNGAIANKKFLQRISQPNSIYLDRFAKLVAKHSALFIDILSDEKYNVPENSVLSLLETHKDALLGANLTYKHLKRLLALNNIAIREFILSVPAFVEIMIENEVLSESDIKFIFKRLEKHDEYVKENKYAKLKGKLEEHVSEILDNDESTEKETLIAISRNEMVFANLIFNKLDSTARRVSFFESTNIQTKVYFIKLLDAKQVEKTTDKIKNISSVDAFKLFAHYYSEATKSIWLKFLISKVDLNDLFSKPEEYITDELETPEKVRDWMWSLRQEDKDFLKEHSGTINIVHESLKQILNVESHNPHVVELIIKSLLDGDNEIIRKAFSKNQSENADLLIQFLNRAFTQYSQTSVLLRQKLFEFSELIGLKKIGARIVEVQDAEFRNQYDHKFKTTYDSPARPVSRSRVSKSSSQELPPAPPFNQDDQSTPEVQCKTGEGEHGNTERLLSRIPEATDEVLESYFANESDFISQIPSKVPLTEPRLVKLLVFVLNHTNYLNKIFKIADINYHIQLKQLFLTADAVLSEHLIKNKDKIDLLGIFRLDATLLNFDNKNVETLLLNVLQQANSADLEMVFKDRNQKHIYIASANPHITEILLAEKSRVILADINFYDLMLRNKTFAEGVVVNDALRKQANLTDEMLAEVIIQHNLKLQSNLTAALQAELSSVRENVNNALIRNIIVLPRMSRSFTANHLTLVKEEKLPIATKKETEAWLLYIVNKKKIPKYRSLTSYELVEDKNATPDEIRIAQYKLAQLFQEKANQAAKKKPSDVGALREQALILYANAIRSKSTDGFAKIAILNLLSLCTACNDVDIAKEFLAILFANFPESLNHESIKTFAKKDDFRQVFVDGMFNNAISMAIKIFALMKIVNGNKAPLHFINDIITKLAQQSKDIIIAFLRQSDFEELFDKNSLLKLAKQAPEVVRVILLNEKLRAKLSADDIVRILVPCFAETPKLAAEKFSQLKIYQGFIANNPNLQALLQKIEDINTDNFLNELSEPEEDAPPIPDRSSDEEDAPPAPVNSTSESSEQESTEDESDDDISPPVPARQERKSETSTQPGVLTGEAAQAFKKVKGESPKGASRGKFFSQGNKPVVNRTTSSVHNPNPVPPPLPPRLTLKEQAEKEDAIRALTSILNHEEFSEEDIAKINEQYEIIKAKKTLKLLLSPAEKEFDAAYLRNSIAKKEKTAKQNIAVTPDAPPPPSSLDDEEREFDRIQKLKVIKEKAGAGLNAEEIQLASEEKQRAAKIQRDVAEKIKEAEALSDQQKAILAAENERLQKVMGPKVENGIGQPTPGNQQLESQAVKEKPENSEVSSSLLASIQNPLLFRRKKVIQQLDESSIEYRIAIDLMKFAKADEISTQNLARHLQKICPARILKSTVEKIIQASDIYLALQTLFNDFIELNDENLNAISDGLVSLITHAKEREEKQSANSSSATTLADTLSSALSARASAIYPDGDSSDDSDDEEWGDHKVQTQTPDITKEQMAYRKYLEQFKACAKSLQIT